MKENTRVIIAPLLAEIRKDCLFFVPVGMALGLLMIWQSRLSVLGYATGKSWPNDLFTDFVPFNAFCLIFLAFIAVGSSATIAKNLGYQWPKLEATVDHLEIRLAQIASLLISFTLGFAITAILHSLLTVTRDGAFLFMLMLIQGCFVVVCFFMAAFVVRGGKPFDQVWPPVITLFLALASITGLILYGS
jgi:hypothetical protein